MMSTAGTDLRMDGSREIGEETIELGKRTNRRKPRIPQKMGKANIDCDAVTSRFASLKRACLQYTLSSTSEDNEDENEDDGVQNDDVQVVSPENVDTIKLEGQDSAEHELPLLASSDVVAVYKSSDSVVVNKPAVGKIPCDVCGREFAKRYMAIHHRSHSNKKKKDKLAVKKKATPVSAPRRQSPRNIRTVSAVWTEKEQEEEVDDLDEEEEDEDKDVDEEIIENSEDDDDDDNEQSKSPRRKLYSCYVCDRSFPKSQMASHLRSHNDAKKYPCYVCDRPFTKQEMATHLRTHNDVREDQNEENGQGEDDAEVETEENNTDSDFSLATEEDDGGGKALSGKRKFKRYPCDVCSKMYRKDYLVEHKRIHTRQKPFECTQCDEKPTFTLLSELKSHNAALHGDRAIECDVCHKMFASKASLRQHKSTHSDEKRFQCEVCGKSFKQSSQYCNHVKTHCEGTPYQCEECGRRYKSVTGLIRHRERHHKGIRHSYPCELCGKTFTRRGKLKDHIMWHKGTSPYICQYCGKRLMSRKTLKTHELIHQDKKPYKCSVCGKSFRQNCVLKRHMSVHTGIKPFCCDLCGKQFIHRVYLVKHTCEMQDLNRTFVTL